MKFASFIWLILILSFTLSVHIIRLMSLFSKSNFFKKKWIVKILEVKKSNMVLYYILIIGISIYGINEAIHKIIKYLGY